MYIYIIIYIYIFIHSSFWLCVSACQVSPRKIHRFSASPLQELTEKCGEPGTKNHWLLQISGPRNDR